MKNVHTFAPEPPTEHNTRKSVYDPSILIIVHVAVIYPTQSSTRKTNIISELIATTHHDYRLFHHLVNLGWIDSRTSEIIYQLDRFLSNSFSYALAESVRWLNCQGGN